MPSWKRLSVGGFVERHLTRLVGRWKRISLPRRNFAGRFTRSVCVKGCPVSTDETVPRSRSEQGRSNRSRGAARERDLPAELAKDAWEAWRTGNSRDGTDCVALKAGERPMLLQVKATAAGPYAQFGPKDRTILRAQAKRAGAVAVLAWWPPDRQGLRLIDEAEWPD